MSAVLTFYCSSSIIFLSSWKQCGHESSLPPTLSEVLTRCNRCPVCFSMLRSVRAAQVSRRDLPHLRHDTQSSEQWSLLWPGSKTVSFLLAPLWMFACHSAMLMRSAALIWCEVQNNGLFVLFSWSVALTGCCVCGYQPGAGAVLARPLKWRPVQEVQPLPGRHQPGEGQYSAAALSQKHIRPGRFCILSPDTQRAGMLVCELLLLWESNMFILQLGKVVVHVQTPCKRQGTFTYLCFL